MFDRFAKKHFFHFKDLVARASSSVSSREAEPAVLQPLLRRVYSKMMGTLLLSSVGVYSELNDINNMYKCKYNSRNKVVVVIIICFIK